MIGAAKMAAGAASREAMWPVPDDPRTGLMARRYSGYFADNPEWTTGRIPDATYYPQSIVSLIDTGGGGNSFTIEWTGYFKPITTGSHTFASTSDDASYVWIGDAALSPTVGNALVNNGGVHGPQGRSGSVSLIAGVYYPFRVIFGEDTGGEEMSLSVTPPSASAIADLTGLIFRDAQPGDATRATWRFALWGGAGTNSAGAGAFVEVSYVLPFGTPLRVKAAYPAATANRSNNADAFGGGGLRPGGDISYVSKHNPGSADNNFYLIAAGGASGGAAGQGGGGGGLDAYNNESVGQDGASNGASGTTPGGGARQGFHQGGVYNGAAGYNGEAGSGMYGGNGRAAGGGGYRGGGSSTGLTDPNYTGGGGGGCSWRTTIPGQISQTLVGTQSANRGTPGNSADSRRGTAGSEGQGGRALIYRDDTLVYNLVDGQSVNFSTW